MKREELKKWREATVEEIETKLSELREQAYKLRHQLKIGQLKNFSATTNIKKEIAVLKTIVGEKNGSKKKNKS
ncbi:MAG: 50S ribosomal protein L29 [Elusimicrobia bacterium]|nr:50S ribosomal protein L29 [Elusimicrobiota bacterium]